MLKTVCVYRRRGNLRGVTVLLYKVQASDNYTLVVSMIMMIELQALVSTKPQKRHLHYY